MFSVWPLWRLRKTARYATVGFAAFVMGSGTVSAAASAIPIGSLFYISMLNGAATTPCSSSTTTAGTTTTCNAVVDQNGQLTTSDSDTHKALNRLQYDSSGNLKVTSQGSSTVSGTVNVGNFPDTQQVSGHVNVDNLPATQQVNGTVNVGNLPATQSVSGTVNVGNLPKDGNGNLNVNVVGGGGGGGAAPVATKVLNLFGSLGTASGDDSATRTVNMNVTYMFISGCSQDMTLSGGGKLFNLSAKEVYLPIPWSISQIQFDNFSANFGCSYDDILVGY
jgi:hypothetical protein